MLCEADANLVRRDANLPGLALLLDPARFAEALAGAYPQAQVSEVSTRYIRYKPGTSCLVACGVRGALGAIEVYARAHGLGVPKLEKAARRMSVPSALGDGVRLLPEHGVAIYPFPNDHELPALQWLDHHPLRSEKLERLLPERPDLWEATLEPLRYKPERRFVARLNGERGAVVLKVYTREDYLLRKGNVSAFAEVPPLRVPRRLGKSRRHHLAVIQWLDGVSLREALSAQAPDRAPWSTVGAALARLHAQKPQTIRTIWTVERYAQQLADAAAAVADVAPQLGDRAARLSARLGEGLMRHRWRARRAIHGDLSADQTLLQNGAVGIVDFDRAAYGDPRMDLGSFRANLVFDVLCGSLSQERGAACFATVLEAYRRESVKDVTRKLDRFVAASLLQLAVEPFRRRMDEWPRRIGEILSAAESYAHGRLAD